MSDLPRRRLMKLGAVSAGAALVPAAGRRRPGRRRLRRRRCARPTTWRCGTTRAPARTGCARCRSATAAWAPWCSATSTPSGCSSTRTPSGPAARTTTSNTARRGGAGADPAAGVRRTSGARRRRLIDQNMLGRPGGPAGLPDRRQPAAGVRQRATGVSEYQPLPGPDHGHHGGDVPAERRALPARGVRQRAGPGDRHAADRRHGRARSRSRRRSTARSARRASSPDGTTIALDGVSGDQRGHGRHGPVPGAGPGRRRGRHRQQLRRHAAGDATPTA